MHGMYNFKVTIYFTASCLGVPSEYYKVLSYVFVRKRYHSEVETKGKLDLRKAIKTHKGFAELIRILCSRV
jgi:hypothetical protein